MPFLYFYYWANSLQLYWFGNITTLCTFSPLQHLCTLLYWTSQYNNTLSMLVQNIWIYTLVQTHYIFNHYSDYDIPRAREPNFQYMLLCISHSVLSFLLCYFFYPVNEYCTQVFSSQANLPSQNMPEALSSQMQNIFISLKYFVHPSLTLEKDEIID